MLGNTEISRVATKYITPDISLEFERYGRDEDRIFRVERLFGKIRKGGLINSLGLKAKARQKKYKKERYAIGNVIKKETFQRLLRSLRNYLIRVMRGRGPNTSLQTVTFT